MRHALLVCAVVAGAAPLAACQPSQEAPTPPPVRPVLTTLAQPTDSVIFGPFAGTVEPRYQSQLGFQIGGRVVARDVTVGDVVKKGQRLAALDPIVSRFDLSRAEAELSDAKAQAENATATEARTRRLMEGGNVTQAQLDAAVARRDTAQARLAQAGASLQKARDQIGYTELRADFDGVVTQRLAEIGQVVSPGQGIVTLARPETREAVVDIPETPAGAMPKDGLFTVVLQSAPEITARGRVREVAPFAEAGTRTRRVRLTLEEPGPAFRLGATITVALERRIERRFVLPATALLDADGRRSVWIVPAADKRGDENAGAQAAVQEAVQGDEPGDRHVERRDVTLDGDGPDGNGRIAVRTGLKSGERVVVAGAHSLRDGQTVRLADDRN
ncbi:efflux RND transporter periplasmic adaptor subunit [Methylorubrum extorquens]|uniref:efflux RND transporter periplasmic adaptor subunit n=1 Tax=Methylorubrum extorquens TaxID=408 RepID=UPI00209F24D7|nr:efflux RND transporter periplasmic adaptor subunit [Methylorubrum extorquens]MCP1538784.1 RND family efflux transporter MFP subunit [Methylorubrum extorquens]